MASTWRTILLVYAFVQPYLIMVAFGVLIFEKTRTSSWKAAVPVLNTISFFEVMTSSDMFWGMLLTGGYLTLLGILIPAESGWIKIVLLLIGGGITYGFFIHACVNGAKRFNKTTGFGLGLAFFPILFFPLLALSKDTKYTPTGC